MKSIKNKVASRSSRLNKNRNRKTKYASTPTTVQRGGGGDYFQRKLREFLIAKEDYRNSDIYLNIFDIRIMLLYIWAMNIPVGDFNLQTHIKFKDEDLTLLFNSDYDIKNLLSNISNIPIKTIKLISKENKTFENLVNECSLIPQDKKTDFIRIFNDFFDTDVKSNTNIRILKKSKNSNNSIQNLKEELIRIFLPIDFDSITSNSNRNNITKLFQGLSLKNSPGLEQHYETPANSVHNHPSHPQVSGRLPGRFNNNFANIDTLFRGVMNESPREPEEHTYAEPLPLTPQKPPRQKRTQQPPPPSNDESLYAMPNPSITPPVKPPRTRTPPPPPPSNDNSLYAMPNAMPNPPIIPPVKPPRKRTPPPPPQSNAANTQNIPVYATVHKPPPPPLPERRAPTLTPPSHPPSPFPPGEGIFNSERGKWKPKPKPRPRTRKHNQPPPPIKEDDEDEPLPPLPPIPQSKRRLPELPASRPAHAPAPASARKHRILPQPPKHQISGFTMEETSF